MKRPFIGVALLAAGLAASEAGAATGWYLMVPPVGDSKWTRPLREWRDDRAFDTAEDCEGYRNVMITASTSALEENRGKNPGVEQVLSSDVEKYSLSRCIAADDPRLK